MLQRVGIAQALLNDPSTSGRATAALMLAHERDQATLDALRDALTDKDWSVRAAAVHALAMRRAPRLRIDLTPLLEDENFCRTRCCCVDSGFRKLEPKCQLLCLKFDP